MPVKKHFPQPGEKNVGGVSERPTRSGVRGSNLSGNHFRRGGRKHPGLRKGGALRGALLERGSWSVRHGS